MHRIFRVLCIKRDAHICNERSTYTAAAIVNSHKAIDRQLLEGELLGLASLQVYVHQVA